MALNALRIKPDPKVEIDIQTASAVTVRIMDIFRPLITYEGAKRDKGHIQEFPGYLHISESMVVKRMLDLGFTTDGESLCINRKVAPPILKRPNVPDIESRTDEQIVEEAVEDALITFRRKEFTIPAKGRLEPAIFDMLVEWSLLEATQFYRITETDYASGVLPLSSRHALRINQPPKSRFRMWTAVDAYVRLYVAIFQDESIQDKVAAMIEYDTAWDMQHDRFLLRWREAGVI